jgi:hypothetical protein
MSKCQNAHMGTYKWKNNGSVSHTNHPHQRHTAGLAAESYTFLAARYVNKLHASGPWQGSYNVATRTAEPRRAKTAHNQQRSKASNAALMTSDCAVMNSLCGLEPCNLVTATYSQVTRTHLYLNYKTLATDTNAPSYLDNKISSKIRT